MFDDFANQLIEAYGLQMPDPIVEEVEEEVEEEEEEPYFPAYKIKEFFYFYLDLTHTVASRLADIVYNSLNHDAIEAMIRRAGAEPEDYKEYA